MSNTAAINDIIDYPFGSEESQISEILMDNLTEYNMDFLIERGEAKGLMERQFQADKSSCHCCS